MRHICTNSGVGWAGTKACQGQIQPLCHLDICADQGRLAQEVGKGEGGPKGSIMGQGKAEWEANQALEGLELAVAAHTKS